MKKKKGINLESYFKMFFNPECVMDVLKFTLNNKNDFSPKL